jgi:hypothetical protein
VQRSYLSSGWQVSLPEFGGNQPIEVLFDKRKVEGILEKSGACRDLGHGRATAAAPILNSFFDG